MPFRPTLPTSRQLAEQLDLVGDELCTPHRLPSPLEAVRAVPDPRTPHLVTHTWSMLLGLVACALLCGVRSVRGVIRWASGEGTGILAAIEVPDGNPGRRPVATTLTRTLARIDADTLGAAVGAFVQAHAADPLAGVADAPPVLQPTADGKTVRGARDEEGLHLLGAYQVDPGVMLTQQEMHHKPHETLHFTAALHTVAGHAHYLHSRRAFGLFCFKENRSAQLDALVGDEHTNPTITVVRHGGDQQRPPRDSHPRPAPGPGKIHADAELGITTGRPDRRRGHSRPLYTQSRGHRGPALRQRRDFRRGHLPGPHRQPAPRPGDLPQPGDQPRPPRRMDQRRRSPRPLPQPFRRRPTRTPSHGMRTHHSWLRGATQLQERFQDIHFTES